MKTKKFCTAEEKAEMIDLYLKNVPVKDILEKYDVSHIVLLKCLKDNGIPFRPRVGNNKIPKKTEDKIIEFYKSRVMTFSEVRDKFGVAENTIGRILKNNNVQVYSTSEVCRTYSMNEHYFDSIDTPNKAYILGFLYTDGCNVSDFEHHKSYGVVLKILQSDIAILEDINKETENESPILIFPNKKPNKNGYYSKPSAQLKFSGEYVARKLDELGVHPRKTFSVTFPEWLDKSLYRHFIRGAIDGDGSLPYETQRRVSLIGNKPFIERIVEIINYELELCPTLYHDKRHKDQIISMRLYGKDNIVRFLDWIYEDADLKLDRKYQSYLLYKEKHVV